VMADTEYFDPNNILLLGPAPSKLERHRESDLFIYNTPRTAYEAYCAYCDYMLGADAYLVLKFEDGIYALVVKKEYYREAAKA